ncbi:29315_t:CDS:2, partial [Gigaspora margarita]
ECLDIIEILKKIQNKQNNQIVSIKKKLPMNRKYPAFKCVNKWLEKYYKGVNTGISIEIKNLKDLEVKFMTQEYNTAVKEFKDLFEYNLKYLSFLNSLDSIKKYGFSGDF